MKNLAIAVGMTAVLGGIAYFVPQMVDLQQEVHYEAPPETVPKEKEYPDEWLEEAEKAKKDVLKRLQLEADIDALDAEIALLEAEKATKEKELGVY